MDGTAVTRIDNQAFKLMSCQKVVSFEKDKAVFNERNIQKLITPLIKKENYDQVTTQSIEMKVRDFLSNLVKQEDGVQQMEWTNNDNKKYKILYHKFKPFVFGFLLYPLSDADMIEIEKNCTGKTYLTGDPSDMFKKKEDFH